ncbi:hypothetical protein BDP27DRAFT_1421284 [Rhodocollybia butyracea]|uniref:Uncharacterized protein n=1 Tax=Rhodocollybia butyracea TaxID=206335 RepID=A0A9P5PTG1_9AGAR|nr:hypothetical protein BDP27DRAFT_1421284 [Rhodocollybia butyracea]
MPTFRSPSPALPGAWPSTYPTPSASISNSMHLDITEKLASRPASVHSAEATLPPSTTFGSTPSQDSQLTRFTPVCPYLILYKSLTEKSVQTPSSNSISALGNITANTSTSTFEDSVPNNSSKSVPSTSETYIRQLPSPETSPDSNHLVYTVTRRVRSTSQSNIAQDESSFISHNSESSSIQNFSSSPETSSPRSLATESSGLGSPLSPMIFVSPATSNRTPPAIRRIREAAAQTYSFTSDEGADYDESGLLRLGSPSLRTSLSSSSPSPRSQRRQEVSVVIVSPMSEEFSSTEELQGSPRPHLTSLSFSGSINLNGSSSGAMPSNEDTEQSPPWTLALTGSSESELSPPLSAFTTSPISVSGHSISPSTSLRAQLENPRLTQVVTFPSPTTLISAQSSSPVEDINFVETNAAEYAAAVMVSSWGSSALRIEPIGSEISRLARNESEGETEMQDRRTVVTSNHPWQKRGILSKVKRIGAKVKQFLQGKPKERLKIEVSSSRRTTNLPVLEIGRENLSVQPTPPILELELGSVNLAIPHRLPSSSGAHPRLRKPRPSLTTQTYSPAAEDRSYPQDTNSSGPPEPADDIRRVIEVTPHSCSPDEPPASQDPATPPMEELQQQLEAYSRPKTLDEIKNKRRLSLSAISNHLASPSGSSRPPTPIAARQRRPRPVSALVLPSIRPRRHKLSVSWSIALEFHRQMGVTRTVRVCVPEVDSESFNSGTATGPRADTRSTTRTNERDRNRFSLSTLSSFAAGLVDHGSWAKFDTRRGDS